MSNLVNNNKGVTFIGLIIVLAMMGVLGSMSTTNMGQYNESLDILAMKTDIEAVKSSVIYHYGKYGEMPIGKKVNNQELCDYVKRTYNIKECNLYQIDPDLMDVDNIVLSTDDSFNSYGFIPSGEFTGKVFHIKGIMDANGVLHYE